MEIMSLSIFKSFVIMLTLTLLLDHSTEVLSQRPSSNMPGETNDGDLPFCSNTKDMPYANCFNLKDDGACEKEKEKMSYYCPIACNACKGEGGGHKAAAPPQPKCLSSRFKCCKDNVTEAKGENFEACPEKCFDTPNYECGFYKDQGFCSNNSVYYKIMLQRCPLTCQMCQPPSKLKQQQGECFDEWRTISCKTFLKHDLCTTLKWKERLGKVCRKTCKKCIHNAPMLLSIAQHCSHDGECCWDKSRRVNGRCPYCKDLFGKSFCENFKGDCNDTRAIKGVQVRILCTRTCGMCETQKCEDDMLYGEFCPQWKKRNDCKKHSIIMNTYCRKTCGFC